MQSIEFIDDITKGKRDLQVKATRKIFIVPYCHADWAWKFTRRWHEKRYVLVFEEVLAILEKHPCKRKMC